MPTHRWGASGLQDRVRGVGSESLSRADGPGPGDCFGCDHTQLTREPLKETRHRKPLRPNPIAPWELRIGPLRVFYEIAGSETRVVRVLAVGRKSRNTVTIGRREVRL